MGIIDDLKRNQERKSQEGAEMLAEEFTGCLSGAAGCLGGIGGFVLNVAWKLPVILIILMLSIFIILPIKLALFIISFGRWNGFENRFLERIGDVYDAKGFYN